MSQPYQLGCSTVSTVLSKRLEGGAKCICHDTGCRSKNQGWIHDNWHYEKPAATRRSKRLAPTATQPRTARPNQCVFFYFLFYFIFIFILNFISAGGVWPGSVLKVSVVCCRDLLPSAAIAMGCVTQMQVETYDDLVFTLWDFRH